MPTRASHKRMAQMLCETASEESICKRGARKWHLSMTTAAGMQAGPCWWHSDVDGSLFFMTKHVHSRASHAHDTDALHDSVRRWHCASAASFNGRAAGKPFLAGAILLMVHSFDDQSMPTFAPFKRMVQMLAMVGVRREHVQASCPKHSGD